MKDNNCTWWPERVLGLDVSFACKYHDWHYARQKVSRWQADVNLYKRVRDEARIIKHEEFLVPVLFKDGRIADGYYYKVGKKRAKLIAAVMFVGVRLFGWYSWRKNSERISRASH